MAPWVKCRDGSVGKVLATKLSNLSETSRLTQRKEGTNSHTLSSDLNTHATARFYTHMYPCAPAAHTRHKCTHVQQDRAAGTLEHMYSGSSHLAHM